jgi:hypothetical protein
MKRIIERIIERITNIKNKSEIDSNVFWRGLELSCSFVVLFILHEKSKCFKIYTAPLNGMFSF